MSSLRILVVLWHTLIVVHSAFAQFQVIEARDATLDGQTIKRFDTIGEKGIIQIRKGGFLSIIHASGNFLEVQGKDKFLLENLTILDDTTTLYLPDYTNILERRSTRFIDGGYVVRTPVYYKPYEDHQSGFQVNINESVCILWEPGDMKTLKTQYKLVVTNIFEEALTDTLVLNGMQYELSLKRLNVVDSSDYDYVLVHLIDDGQSQIIAVMNVVEEHFIVPNFCNPQTSTECVIAAYYLETEKLHKTALNYYARAIELSDEAIFQEILAVAKRRMNLN